MKKRVTLFNQRWLLLCCSFCLLLLIPTNNLAQQNSYSFIDVDTVDRYRAVGYARTVNYLIDHAVVDSSGTIHFVYVDNYKLFCHTSTDGGQNWSEEQIITGYEGKVYSAMIGLTQAGKRVIVYSVNVSFNNGTVPSWNEFYFNTYGVVETDQGWKISNIFIHSSNYGYTPFGIITTKDGTVHAMLHKNGWYNYGGEIYEIIYTPETNTWSSLITVKVFNDRSVDFGTNYMAKLAEGEENNIICMYQRFGSKNLGEYKSVEVMEKTAEGWQEPVVVLANSTYSTYNRFEIDYDRHGNTYLGYFEPWGENGPELFLAHNSTTEFEKYEIFEDGDTLRKMDFVPIEGALLIYCNLLNKLPVVLKWSESGLELTGYIPEFAAEDSTDVMRFHYHIPRKSNFSSNMDLLAFTNRSQGRDPSNTQYILPYPLVFVRANIQAPSLVSISCPADTTIGCDQSIEPDNVGVVMAEGTCGGDIAIAYDDEVTAGGCGNEKVITRTWTAADECENIESCIQKITVIDTIPANISCPADTMVICNESTEPENVGEASADDYCDGDVDITYKDSIQAGDCTNQKTIFRFWIATDACGNVSECIQEIGVIDTVAPVVTCPADVNIDCTASTDPSNTGTAVATDNCDNDVSITYIDSGSTDDCPGLITRNWIATDACGIKTTCIQLISLIDNTSVDLAESVGEVLLYPNPADDLIFIILPDDFTDKTIVIYNSRGTKVMEADLQREVFITISNLTSGLYFIRNTSNTTMGKFVKR